MSRLQGHTLESLIKAVFWSGGLGVENGTCGDVGAVNILYISDPIYSQPLASECAVIKP